MKSNQQIGEWEIYYCREQTLPRNISSLIKNKNMVILLPGAHDGDQKLRAYFVENGKIRKNRSGQNDLRGLDQTRQNMLDLNQNKQKAATEKFYKLDNLDPEKEKKIISAVFEKFLVSPKKTPEKIAEKAMSKSTTPVHSPRANEKSATLTGKEAEQSEKTRPLEPISSEERRRIMDEASFTMESADIAMKTAADQIEHNRLVEATKKAREETSPMIRETEQTRDSNEANPSNKKVNHSTIADHSNKATETGSGTSSIEKVPQENKKLRESKAASPLSPHDIQTLKDAETFITLMNRMSNGFIQEEQAKKELVKHVWQLSEHLEKLGISNIKGLRESFEKAKESLFQKTGITTQIRLNALREIQSKFHNKNNPFFKAASTTENRTHPDSHPTPPHRKR